MIVTDANKRRYFFVQLTGTKYNDWYAIKRCKIYSSLDPALFSNPIETSLLIVHEITCHGDGQVVPRPSFKRNSVLKSSATSRNEKFCRVEVEL
jgi:hypothetical protein